MLRTATVAISLCMLLYNSRYIFVHVVTQHPYEDRYKSIIVFYFYFCIINCHKFSELNDTNLVSYISVGQKSQNKIKVSAGLCFFLMAAGETPFSCSFWLLAKFSSCSCRAKVPISLLAFNWEPFQLLQAASFLGSWPPPTVKPATLGWVPRTFHISPALPHLSSFWFQPGKSSCF